MPHAAGSGQVLARSQMMQRLRRTVGAVWAGNVSERPKRGRRACLAWPTGDDAAWQRGQRRDGLPGQPTASAVSGRWGKGQIDEKTARTNRWEAGQEPRSATCRVTRRMRTYTWS